MPSFLPWVVRKRIKETISMVVIRYWLVIYRVGTGFTLGSEV